MDTTQKLTTQRFPRRPMRGLAHGLSTAQLITVLTGVVLVAACLLNQNVIGVFVVIIVTLLCAFVTVSGTHVCEWAPIAGEFVFRKQTGQTTYRADVTTPRPAGTLMLPGDGAALRWYDHTYRGRPVCLVHDPHRNTISATLKVTHPAYMLLSPDEKNQRPRALSSVYASLARSEQFPGLQILEATIPDAGRGLAAYHAEHGVNNQGFPGREYRRALELSHADATTHLSTVTHSLDMSKASAAIKASGGGISGAAKVFERDMRALERQLERAAIEPDHWLAANERAHLMRLAWDPALGTSFTAEHPGARMQDAGPMAVDEMFDRLRHDSGWSMTFWISDFPRTEVYADWLHSLIFEPVRKTVCLTVKPKPTRKALREIRHEKGSHRADQIQKAQSGRVQALSDNEELQDILDREQAIGVGHAAVDFAGWVTVTVETEEQLSEAKIAVENAVRDAGAEARIVYGRQAQAFLVGALPLGRMAF